MDAMQLGPFIAERRKELGMTQALLAEKLHVTDKAVSRWERGVGLPDINSIEALANALDVSLVELMQAKRNQNGNISTKEVEVLLLDTIEMSKPTSKVAKGISMVILTGFAWCHFCYYSYLHLRGKSCSFLSAVLLPACLPGVFQSGESLL